MTSLTKLLIILTSPRYLLAGLLLPIGHYWLSSFDLSELKSEYFLNQSHQQAWGTLDNKWYTGSSDKYAYEFSFVVPELGEFKGRSYNKFDKFSPGDSVLIEYYPVDPHFAQIAGMAVLEKSRTNAYGALILLIIGFSIALHTFFKRIGVVNMLKPANLIKVKLKGHKRLEWWILDGVTRNEQYDTIQVISFEVSGKGVTKDIRDWKYSSRLYEKDQYALLDEKGRFFPLNRLPKFLTKRVINSLENKTE